MALHKMIENRADLKDWLKYEKSKYKRVTFLYGLGLLTEQDAIWKYQRRLRITEYYQNTGKKIRYLFSRMFLHRMQFRYGMKVKLNSCGRGLKIMHLGSLLTNGDLGEDCSLHVNVSIVSGGRDTGTPVIGNHCVLGVGAAVVGSVTLGNGIAVGANAVVTKSFEEDNIAIAGVPAKKISDNGSGTWNKKNNENKE
ncbi:MAG: serine acetyltransferase [Clostridia bacterium]|nr:serine acetyltransferase [Clostridia bacterium]